MRRVLLPTLLVCIFLSIGFTVSAQTELTPPVQLTRLCWVAFAPTNFNPDQGQYPGADSILLDLKKLRRAGFSGIITYGSESTLGTLVPQLAQTLGDNVASTRFRGMIMGVWDPTNETEIQNAIAAAQYPVVLGYSVGNEGLGVRYTLQQLTATMDRIRQATGKPVTTTEESGDYVSGSALLDLGDWIFANAHPFWANVRSPDPAVAWTDGEYRRIKNLRPQRLVFFKEVGLPTGPDADLSQRNQRRYYRRLWPTIVNFAYFEGFDQPFKGVTIPVEAHWGIFDLNRTPKLVVPYVCGRTP